MSLNFDLKTAGTTILPFPLNKGITAVLFPGINPVPAAFGRLCTAPVSVNCNASFGPEYREYI